MDEVTEEYAVIHLRQGGYRCIPKRLRGVGGQ